MVDWRRKRTRRRRRRSVDFVEATRLLPLSLDLPTVLSDDNSRCVALHRWWHCLRDWKRMGKAKICSRVSLK